MGVKFEGTLFLPNPAKSFTFVMLSPEAGAQFPDKGMSPLKGTINGTPFEASVHPLKDGGRRIYISKALREATGLKLGDTAIFEVEPAE